MWTRTWVHDDLAANVATPACIANRYYLHGLLPVCRLILNKFAGAKAQLPGEDREQRSCGRCAPGITRT
jgi:hypothetical protein